MINSSRNVESNVVQIKFKQHKDKRKIPSIARTFWATYVLQPLTILAITISYMRLLSGLLFSFPKSKSTVTSDEIYLVVTWDKH